ncbi:MAG: Hpt domain-containing protein [Solirubrobacterales bacterium]|nr:Hpt domain-containing protein [Solirubrobacterales bacterium]MCB8915801.1 Hpt domain-containing protein [Thermoleophilales bacterium]
MSGSIENETLEDLATQMGGREALGRIINMYTGKLPAEMDALGASFEAGDLDDVRTSAHRLKSSSGQLGARRLQVMLAGLESAAGEGDVEATGRILKEVSAEAELTRAELNELSP